MPDRRGRVRPQQETDSSRSVVAAEASSPIIQSAAHQIAARRRWSYRLVSRCTEPPPTYGSVAWLALPEGDRAKIGAVVIAAECWARAGDDLEIDLRREIDAARLAHKQADDADYRARSVAHRAKWSRLPSSGKSFVARRAEQLASVKPRRGDYTGRGSA